MRIWPAAAAVLVLALTAGTAPAAAVVVDAEGIVSEIAVTWGRASSFWKYTITYSRLGETAALVAPADARPLVRSTS